jgi:predicted DNA-binding transcriptional regulator YafY
MLVETDRGRGGGVRLDSRWGIERLNITNKEAVSLLLSLSITEVLSPLSVDLGLKALKQKVANVFPESQRKSIIELRKKVLIGKPAASHVVNGLAKTSDSVWETVMRSFFDSRSTDLEYKDEKGNISKRRFDTHYLLLNWPAWYLLGWDHLRQNVRVLRIDRIKTIQIRNDTIPKRPRALFEETYKEYFREI